MSDMSQQPLEGDDQLQALLAPLPGPDPCGVSLRADPLFTEIRLAREEDDPSLPMRQWERPLKAGDWPGIEARCTEALTARSKDLQLAAWLTEAWIRQGQGIAGLARGLHLLCGLVDRYWAELYPRLDPPEEGGGCEARVAPLDWLARTIPHVLRIHVCLFPQAERKPSRVTLADWEQLISSELSGSPDRSEALEVTQETRAPLAREDIVADVVRHAPEWVGRQLGEVREARAHLMGLSGALDRVLGVDSPNFERLAAVLDAFERVLVQAAASMNASRALDPAPTASAPAQRRATVPSQAAGSPSASRSDPQEGPLGANLVSMENWQGREQAYQTLEALAQYLMVIEPHSPTPYLVQRAVNWGRLPLPELMKEILQEEGDLNRMVQLLRLNR
jgi:type VI secretion system protein ImpA